ncbi:hypothetical protein SBA3_750027 [Candidatus Sulfopaludibacter sp. SbA3]|nr:hypothetical protein SBA3_750027 [Candidatus Sulfopaludibacter sp. SbA3]
MKFAAFVANLRAWLRFAPLRNPDSLFRPAGKHGHHHEHVLPGRRSVARSRGDAGG